MGLRINTNVAALTSHRHLTITDKNLQKSLERLSSGYRINHASDDAAGLAIANRFSTSIRSLSVAQRNITEATSVVQVAEGAANQIQGILERLKELATQAASDNVSDVDRSKINTEATQLKSEIDRIANSTRYQGSHLIDGTYGNYASISTGPSDANALTTSGIILDGVNTGTVTITDSGGSGDTTTITATWSDGNTTITQTISGISSGQQLINFDDIGLRLQLTSDYDVGELTGTSIDIANSGGGTFQVGDKNNSEDRLTGVTLGDFNTNAIGQVQGEYVSDIDLSSQSGAQKALDILDQAIDEVANHLANMGAYMNRLSYASQNVAVTVENFSASESVIRDVDMASEMTNLTKNQILMQAGTAMLAQANATPQQVLALFQ